MNKYKAAIIGCGKIGGGFDAMPGEMPVYTHAGAYSMNKQIRLTAVADINIDRLSKFAKKWKISNTYRSYEELFNNETIDIVSVCTTKDLHYDIIKSAVKHDVKIVFCEKPFTGDFIQAKNAVSMCEAKRITLSINFTRRFTQSHQRIKTIIDSGRLGTIQSVNCYYTKGMINNGSHAINLLTYFFGAPAFVRSLSMFDTKPVLADYDISGVLYFKMFMGTIIACSAEHFSLFEIDIIGSNGRIKIDNSGYDIRWHKVQTSRVFKGYRELSREGLVIESDMEDAMRNALDNTIKGYENKQKLLCSGRDTLSTLKIIDAAVSSACSKGIMKEIK
ncbi:MAG: Gfo/Idh/MocA family oxidoreductase [Elusimicrobiota bacterium]